MFLIIILYLFIVLSIISYSILYFTKHYRLIKRYILSKSKRWKALRWKKKNIRESIDIEKNYSIKFNLIVNDIGGNHKVSEYFDITIPATAPFFARRKLEKYIKENINIQINTIDELRIP